MKTVKVKYMPGDIVYFIDSFVIHKGMVADVMISYITADETAIRYQISSVDDHDSFEQDGLFDTLAQAKKVYNEYYN